jgi:hypothetical protein
MKAALKHEVREIGITERPKGSRTDPDRLPALLCWRRGNTTCAVMEAARGVLLPAALARVAM